LIEIYERFRKVYFSINVNIALILKIPRPRDTEQSNIQHCDIQHKNIQYNSIQHNNIQHNNIQHNNIQHNNIQHCDIQRNDCKIIFSTKINKTRHSA
jgi:hypothetical protein